ncbi:MAG: acetyl/propionyl/methylcrotonyl-CoA carboxylase subunit alpha [Alphaproteobacteria bacterium]
MFEKILIANRGEIACRVIRTARRMRIATVAVHSEADAQALHVALADESQEIGPAPAVESYLRGDAIVEAAKASGAAAIHPGYGFLAENADFAEACAAAGLVFIGPPPAVIRAMGDKAAAKTLMADAGIPVLPGDSGEDQDDAALARAAERVGYPLLIKPAVGGGGKGMRVVAARAAFAEALAAARREAEAAFGDGRVLLERYLDRPRHIEVQVFADTHGNVVHLFERDCSLQRRHQKVVEEAPAPRCGGRFRRRIAETAVEAARAAGYVGAGTVEFLVDGENRFYFLEMNTRLQVEHPVTEMITGRDLVEWQLRIAAGEKLPCAQADLVVAGHAIEARIYAEDPARGFLPASGRIDYLRAPVEGEDLRFDTGVRVGDEVSPHYDPLLAKLVVHGRNRTAALERLRHALADLRIVGPATNLEFLSAIANHRDFTAGRADTGLIERERATLAPEPVPAPDRVLAFACLDTLLRLADEAAARSRDRGSPWNLVNGWRLNGEATQTVHFLDGDEVRTIAVRFRRGSYSLTLSDAAVEVDRARRDAEGNLEADFDGERCAALVIARGRETVVLDADKTWRLSRHDPLEAANEDGATGGRLTSPMPGRIVAVLAEVGREVARGEPLMVVEAMKMEHTITAPAGGRIARINYAAGDRVEEGAELIAFGAEDGT